MTGFDDISRAIGRIEGKVEGLKESTEAQWEKLDQIESILTSHRLRTATLAGVVSAFMTGAFHFLKGTGGHQ